MTDVEKIIEIRDPEINVEEIMNRIRERVRQRREQAQSQGLDYDRLVDEGLSGASLRLPADLYFELHQLCTKADAIGVTLAVRDRQLPLINPLFFRIEKLLHRLVVRYVNMLAGRQITINRSTAHLFSGLARAFEEQDARIEALEKQVAELRERLAQAGQSHAEQG